MESLKMSPKKRINQAIEQFSKGRLEKFSTPMVILFLLIWVGIVLSIVFTMEVRILIKKEGRESMMSLKSLVWKVRTNR